MNVLSVSILGQIVTQRRREHLRNMIIGFQPSPRPSEGMCNEEMSIPGELPPRRRGCEASPLSKSLNDIVGVEEDPTSLKKR